MEKNNIDDEYDIPMEPWQFCAHPNWEMEGVRGCPKGNDDCSQTVYRCPDCGEWDYGYKDGPAWKECFVEFNC